MSTPADYGLPHSNFRPHQLESIQWIADSTPFVPKITEQPTGCHAKGQGILMYNGSVKLVEDVVVGDLLMGPDYTSRLVWRLCRGTGQMYDILAADGKWFTANDEHVLVLASSNANDFSVAEMSVTELIQQDYNWLLMRNYPTGTEMFEFMVLEHDVAPYYGFTIDGDNRYLLADYTVTRNSGKSSVAMGQSIHGQTIVVTKSKNLQVQYGDLYSDCAVLFGRRNYSCNHKDTPPSATADDCLFRENMHKCPVASQCAYLNAKELAHNSQRVALNYAYWLTTHKKWQPYQLVLDEAHNLSDIVLDWVGCTIDTRDLQRWELPDVPTISVASTNPLFPTPDQTPEAIAWLSASIKVLNATLEKILKKQLTEKNLQDKRACEGVLRKLTNTREALQTYPGSHWYIRSGDNALWNGAGFVCKPLTARYDAPRFFFQNRPRVLCMSATIGQVSSFANELGIDKFDYRTVPNQWDASVRPVWILDDCPPMGKSSVEKNPATWQKQADVIAKAILACPSYFSGHILVTRKIEAKLLAERLEHCGLADRIWVSLGSDGAYTPTNEQLIAWEKRKLQVPNSICCGWWGWEGMDAKTDSIVIVSKIAFPFLGDSYERARMVYDGRMYRQRAAWLVEQGCGRVRRGEISDYNLDGKLNTMVSIADGALPMIKKYLSESMRESLIGWS